MPRLIRSMSAWLHQHLFHHTWIRWVLSYVVLFWNIQPAFSESSVRWP